MILFYIMQPQSRRTFTIGWTAGALFVLCCQIIAVAPPVVSGAQRVILIGPVAVVLAALPVSFLVLWLITRNNGAINAAAPARIGRLVGAATTGLLASVLTILVLTVTANVAIAQIARFSN